MKVVFLDVAEAELSQTIFYYNGQSEGLGFEFAAEVKRVVAVMHLHKHPLSWKSRLRPEQM